MDVPLPTYPYGKSLYKPYKYHGYTVRGTPNCPLIDTCLILFRSAAWADRIFQLRTGNCGHKTEGDTPRWTIIKTLGSELGKCNKKPRTETTKCIKYIIHIIYFPICTREYLVYGIADVLNVDVICQDSRFEKCSITRCFIMAPYHPITQQNSSGRPYHIYHPILLLMTEILNNHLGWCWNPINNGINDQPQLVNAGFQPSTVSPYPCEGRIRFMRRVWYYGHFASWVFMHAVKVHPGKLTWQWKNPSFEDVSPIENGEFPLPCWFLGGYRIMTDCNDLAI